jgi:hypothetical protein
MLDDRMRMMLEAANTLTAEDLDFIRADGVAVAPVPQEPCALKARPSRGFRRKPPKERVSSESSTSPVVTLATPVSARCCGVGQSAAAVNAPAAVATPMASSRGEYERNRTRESKVSTGCLGVARSHRIWWLPGTELVGRIGNEVFTAQVIENPAVKSGRSLRITSGPAQGRVCLTPTRAAIEATEAYRQAYNLGRGGGVTNGWVFWQAQ